MRNSGYIYVLINHSMENLVKVGKTTRDAESRAKELSSVTGIPTPFIVAFDECFDNCDEAEDYIHKKLEQKGFRLSNNREFFQAPLKEVISVIVEAKQFFASKNNLVLDSKTQTNQSDNESEITLQIAKEPWSEIEAIAEYFLADGNYEDAYRLYKQALTLGSKKSFYPLGCMTLSGMGCLEDTKEGLELLQQGVNNGDGRCYGGLSEYYFYKAKNYSIAEKWFENYLKSGCFVNQQPDAGHALFALSYTAYIFSVCPLFRGKFKVYYHQ
jgi:hypothetical protein